MQSLTTKVTTMTNLKDALEEGRSCINELWSFRTKNRVTSVCAADMNLDGDIEVLAGSRDGRNYARTREGKQIWDQVVGHKAGVNAILAIPDPSGQQAMHIISATRDGMIYAFNKDGKDEEEILVHPGEQDFPPPPDDLPQPLYAVGNPILQLQFIPAPSPTLVFGTEDGNVYSFDMTSGKGRRIFSTNGQIRAIATCDLTGDQHWVALVGSEDHTLSVLSSTGTILAQRRMDQALFSLLADDINGDGKVEILAGTRDKKLFVLHPDLSEMWSLTLSSRPLAFALADVNNDQQSEILVACDDQSLSILDNAGTLLWHEEQSKRFSSLYAVDLDRDGHTEIIAGADDYSVYALRIQVRDELYQEILDLYTSLEEPDPFMLPTLSNDQRDLLLYIAGSDKSKLDDNLSLEGAEALLAAEKTIDALLSLLELDQQKFQLLWEQETIGYLGTLCLASILSSSDPAVIVSSLDEGIQAFTLTEHLLWLEKPPKGEQVRDVQSGYLSKGRREDLVFLSSSGQLWFCFMNTEKEREIVPFAFPEPISCFHVLTQSHAAQGSAELLVGSKSGKVCLYTKDFTIPAQTWKLPPNVEKVYATKPHEGLYRTPEILITTAPNHLFAYTRGGNKLWEYETHDRILALCAEDLDGDGSLDVLIGSEGCNIYMLDNQGNLRWRYFLSHSVLSLETADLDGDGRLEILVGCADSIIYVFRSTGDLIWRYQAKDRVQALRVIDTNQDKKRGIAVISEGRLEILQMINQVILAQKIEDCWSRLLTDRDPIEALLPLIQHANPTLRAAALNKLSTITPRPKETLAHLENALHDPTVTVLKALPAAIMRLYPADNARARSLLDTLFTDKRRDVGIEVIEQLELLAPHDWNATLSFLNRSLQSPDRNTRRAAIRKISHLIGGTADTSLPALNVPAEALFRLLQDAAQGTEREWGKSEWVQQEAARVLADLLNRFPGDVLVYLYQLLKHQVSFQILQMIAFHLDSPDAQRAFVSLLALSFELNESNALDRLANATNALAVVHEMRYATDLWLIFNELQGLFTISSIKDLASYEFHLRQEHFQDINYTIQSFLRVAERFSTITRLFKTYEGRSDPNDRWKSLQEGLAALENLQRLVHNEYRASLVPNSPQPPEPEFVTMKVLLIHWQRMLNSLINDLQFQAKLVFKLPLHKAYFEDRVAFWLQITNEGRDIAHNVRVTLLNNEHCSILSSLSQIKGIFPQQQAVAEFLIRPHTLAPLTLTIEILYDDSQHNAHTFTIQESLGFVQWPHEFTRIENPYSTGTPARNNRMFYGRETELNYLQSNLTRTQAQTVLVLHGQRRSGKTSLLYQLANSSLLMSHVPVMIDLQGIYDFSIENLLFKVAYGIYQAMKRKDLPVSRPIRADFVEGSRPDPTFAFDCFLDEIEEVFTHQKLILLLDEFEELDEHVEKGDLPPRIFKYLRSVMQKRAYIHFLLSGTHRMEQLTRDYWSIFFNIALHYRLPSKITDAGAESLITKPVSDSFEYDNLAVVKIRQLTGDQPYLINLVCDALVDQCNEMHKNYATLNDVNLVLEKVIDTGAIHFNWLWKKIDPKKRLLLQVIAEGTKESRRKVSLENIRSIYREHGYSYDRDQIIDDLSELWLEDVIEITKSEKRVNIIDGTLYHIPIGLLRHWLRNEHPLLTKNLP